MKIKKKKRRKKRKKKKKRIKIKLIKNKLQKLIKKQIMTSLLFIHTLLILLILLFLSCQAESPPSKQTLEPYSFDYSAHKVPLAYDTYESSVELLTKIKLLQAVRHRQGAVFLNKV